MSPVPESRFNAGVLLDFSSVLIPLAVTLALLQMGCHPSGVILKTSAFILLQLATLELYAADTRTFTDTQGREIVAELMTYEGTTVKIRRTDGRVFSFEKDLLSKADQEFVDAQRQALQAKAAGLPGHLDARVIAGQNFILEFPDLPKMNGGAPAACEVHIPKNFNYPRPVPLLVWFSGGTGSHRVAGANGVVNFDDFVVIALPYPNGKLPRIAVQEGDIDKHWEFQRPMLKKVIELIPNIDRRARIAAGTSSGAHNIGSGLDKRWKGFSDYFDAFVLHEGGTSPANELSGAKNKRVYVLWGEKSTAREWQEWFNSRIERCGSKLTIESQPTAGHGLNGEGKAMIRKWIETVALAKPKS